MKVATKGKTSELCLTTYTTAGGGGGGVAGQLKNDTADAVQKESKASYSKSKNAETGRKYLCRNLKSNRDEYTVYAIIAGASRLSPPLPLRK